MSTIIWIVIIAVVVVAVIVKFMFLQIQQLPVKLCDFFLSMPTAEEVLKMSTEELRNLPKRKLAHLEDVALVYKKISDPQDAVLWDDLLRRIDIALNGF